VTAPSTTDAYRLSTVDLDDTTYEISQSGIRNAYTVRDSTDTVVLQTTQKLLQIKEEFPFRTGDEEPAFTVKAGGIVDVAGTYTLVDDGTDEAVVVLDSTRRSRCSQSSGRSATPKPKRRWRRSNRRTRSSPRHDTSSRSRMSSQTRTRSVTRRAHTSAASTASSRFETLTP